MCLDDLSTFQWFGGLDPIRQRALVDMRFQLGPIGFRGFSRMIAAVAAGDYARAAVEALDSDWFRQDTPARAARVSSMLETGREVGS